MTLSLSRQTRKRAKSITYASLCLAAFATGAVAWSYRPPAESVRSVFNGQILSQVADLSGNSSVITVNALRLPTDTAYRVQFSDWQTNTMALDVIVFGNRSTDIALPHGQYRAAVTPFSPQDGMPDGRPPMYVSAAPLQLGIGDRTSTKSMLDLAKAMGVPRDNATSASPSTTSEGYRK